LLTPGLRCQIRALALERGQQSATILDPHAHAKVGATTGMRSTARLSPLTLREASTPCSES
jgi:hypothetical protein